MYTDLIPCTDVSWFTSIMSRVCFTSRPNTVKLLACSVVMLIILRNALRASRNFLPLPAQMPSSMCATSMLHSVPSFSSSTNVAGAKVSSSQPRSTSV